jgi:hypothetical protein
MGKAKEIAELGDKITVSGGTVTVADISTSTFSGTSIHSMQDVDLTGIAHNMFLKYNLSNTQFEVVAGNTSSIDEGSNLYYTDARVASYLSSNDFDTATNIVASITDSAPSTLDTLNELAAALGDDANFSTTVTNSIATKLPLAGGTLTGTLTVTGANTHLDGRNSAGLTLDLSGTGHYTIKESTTNDIVKLGGTGTSNFIAHNISSGNVGIGTTNPGKLLTLSRATEAANEQLEFRVVGGITNNNYDGIKWSQGSSGGTTLATQRVHYYNTGEVDMGFSLRNDANILYLKRGGNVGIGTPSPAEKLTVNGIIASSSTGYSANVNTANFGLYTSGSNPTTYVQMPASGEFHVWKPSTAAALIVKNNGDVSIGSDHAGFSGWKVLNIRQNSTGGMLNFEEDDGVRAFTFANQGSGMRYQAHISGGYHRFETNAAANALYINDSGNVGIGISGPNESLHVYRSSGDASFKLQNAIQTLRIDQNSIRTATSSAVGMFTNNNSSNGFRIESDGRMIIGNTSGQTNVKLTVSGNVKMGSAAHSSWANSINDIGGLDIIVGSGSTGLTVWDDNAQTTPRFKVTRAGNVAIGNTDPTDKLTMTVGNGGGILQSTYYSGTVTNAQKLGVIGFKGYSQGNTVAGADAKIEAVAAGNHSGTSAPANLDFYTKPASIGPGSAAVLRHRIHEEGHQTIYRGTNNWSVQLHNENSGCYVCHRLFWAGSSTTTHNLLRFRRHYWGSGSVKFTLSQTYYIGTSEGEYWLTGHGRSDGSYNPSYNLAYVEVYNGPGSGRLSLNQPGGSPGNSDAEIVDVSISIPAYYYYMVRVEVSHSQYYTTTSVMGSSNSFALFT